MGKEEAYKRLMKIAERDKDGKISIGIDDMCRIVSEEIGGTEEQVRDFLYANASDSSELSAPRPASQESLIAKGVKRTEKLKEEA